ncbi:hypothetical protein AVU43_gp24 [Ralstonia phage RSJ5]|uniref:dATP/dGTP diphosphohydrolase N-terminal domain-containing protein n=1 Tax=Ralstonia phage RSJ5 TaxID=1538364 RepID=A0A077KVP6_9CAUD|nr:hypothetical protein AVU43_gp24 [Ralstonia phage RSJ5]BAP34918.1 hypothetical protein [Ralstonia phage RSJ5]
MSKWKTADELARSYGVQECEGEYQYAWFCQDDYSYLFLTQEHYRLCLATKNNPPGESVTLTDSIPLSAPALESKELAVTTATDATALVRGGLKFDGDKVRFELLWEGMPRALNGIAAVLTFGAKKYAAHSWQTVPEAKARYLAAMLRHLNQIAQGEIYDAESGLPHIDHVACNALFLAELNRLDGTLAKAA